jgi:hypothetical protein
VFVTSWKRADKKFRTSKKPVMAAMQLFKEWQKRH